MQSFPQILPATAGNAVIGKSPFRFAVLRKVNIDSGINITAKLPFLPNLIQDMRPGRPGKYRPQDIGFYAQAPRRCRFILRMPRSRNESQYSEEYNEYFWFCLHNN